MFSIPRTVVRALIQDSATGDYLLVKSSLPGDRGYFSLPGGGIGTDEHPERALLRELSEEIGLTRDAIASIEPIEPSRPYYMQWMVLLPFKNTVYLYKILLLEKPELTPNWEIKEYRWTPEQELASLLHPRFRVLLPDT
jgi:8-oxo-dGTP pyrophosphatase MutT (NUDIX family)